ncbi:MAG: C40 family peptidase [Bacteroidetes bacterium]|nr:C40 family peptidase [Bacteroidota bacterium]
MRFGVIELSLIPVRKEPADQSEMINQLLFGDLVAIDSAKDNWLHIRSLSDNYEGWVDQKQVHVIDDAEFNRLDKLPVHYVHELIEIVTSKNLKRPFPVLFGSSIRGLKGDEFQMGGQSYQFTGELLSPSSVGFPDSILENALMFINAPYLWGGKSVFGMDCSGFTQLLFRLAGAELLRDASQQATMGESVSLMAEAKPGDMMFFDNEDGQIVHVGILMANHQIIHASGRVRIDQVDHQGIYNHEYKKYTHQLRLIKRIL